MIVDSSTLAEYASASSRMYSGLRSICFSPVENAQLGNHHLAHHHLDRGDARYR